MPPKQPTKLRKPQVKPHTWKPAFLQKLGEWGNVSAACEFAGVERSTAYDARETDAEFAAAWRAMDESITDRIEQTAVHLAVEERDARTVQFMLRSRRRDRYGDRVAVEHSGRVVVDMTHVLGRGDDET